jgi:hypothetical protein
MHKNGVRVNGGKIEFPNRPELNMYGTGIPVTSALDIPSSYIS